MKCFVMDLEPFMFFYYRNIFAPRIKQYNKLAENLECDIKLTFILFGLVIILWHIKRFGISFYHFLWPSVIPKSFSVSNQLFLIPITPSWNSNHFQNGVSYDTSVRTVHHLDDMVASHVSASSNFWRSNILWTYSAQVWLLNHMTIP